MAPVRVSKNLVLALLSVFLAGGHACASPHDFQYWNSNVVSWKVAKDWKLSLSQEVYLKDDANDFYYEHTEFGVLYSGFLRWLDLGVNFRHALTESPSNIWKREERPSLQGILKFKLKDFDFSDRNRFEYRIREDADDGWRYRNLLTIKFPVKLTRYNIQPYISDEFFADIEKEEFSENRSYIGFSFKLSKSLGADLYYMWRRVKSSGIWTTHNVLGTRLRLDF